MVPVTGMVEAVPESEEQVGYSRYRDPITEELGHLAADFDSLRKTRLAVLQRGNPGLAEQLETLERKHGAAMTKTLRKHPIWPWLSQFPGLGGVHVARLMSRIGDPLRFPGRVCAKGHHVASDFADDECPWLLRADGHREVDLPGGSQDEAGGADPAPERDHLCGSPCLAPLSPTRRGTGVRSVWHYAGVHVVNGKSPRFSKGVKGDWDPISKTCLLMPGGIAEQIVRLRVPVYREKYQEAKQRLQRERGAEPCGVNEGDLGSALSTVAEGAVIRCESDRSSGPLRPFQIDAIARKVAAKAFLGDLLIAWKTAVQWVGV